MIAGLKTQFGLIFSMKMLRNSGNDRWLSLKALILTTAIGLTWMNHQSLTIPSWPCPLTVFTTLKKVKPLCIETCTTCMEHSNIKLFFTECFNEIIISIGLSFWLELFILDRKSMDRTGLAIIEKDSKSCKRRSKCCCQLVWLGYHLVVQMCLASQGIIQIIQLLTRISLAYLCHFLERIVTDLIH